jgi:hypothetical protein
MSVTPVIALTLAPADEWSASIRPTLFSLNFLRNMLYA